MTTSTLARIERGQSNLLFTTLVKIADALEMPVDEIARARGKAGA